MIHAFQQEWQSSLALLVPWDIRLNGNYTLCFNIYGMNYFRTK